MSKDIGWNLLKKESKYNFLKWGEYMKRAQLAERKVKKLKELILLTDPSVSNVIVTDTTLTQWSEFLKEFPDEADKIAGGE